MSFLRSVILAAVLCLPFVGAAQDEPAPEVSLDAEGPVQLLERGRRAYAESNFAEAEQALEKFITDYGEAEEAKEAARIHTPLVALCKVKLEKFDEAWSGSRGRCRTRSSIACSGTNSASGRASA